MNEEKPNEEEQNKTPVKKQKKNNFKENWLKEDILCGECGKVKVKQRGLTKQNLKRLITPTWELNEILITLMLVMMIGLAFVYQSETKQCRDWITPMFEGDVNNCKWVCDTRCQMLEEKKLVALNLTNATLTTINELNELNGTPT
jgi:hypothetical protein